MPGRQRLTITEQLTSRWEPLGPTLEDPGAQQVRVGAVGRRVPAHGASATDEQQERGEPRAGPGTHAGRAGRKRGREESRGAPGGLQPPRPRARLKVGGGAGSAAGGGGVPGGARGRARESAPPLPGRSGRAGRPGAAGCGFGRPDSSPGAGEPPPLQGRPGRAPSLLEG